MDTPTSPTPQPSPKTKPDVVFAAGGTLCVAALFFEWMGWIMAIVGIVLLMRASSGRAATKMLLASVALLPRVGFVAARVIRAPAGLSFTFEPWTFATAWSVWTVASLLIGFGALAIVQHRRPQPAPSATPPLSQRRLPTILLGLAFVIAGLVVLSGILDGFHRIDDVGAGRWAIQHAARGTVATFAAADIASIEGTESRSSRGASALTVRLTLTDGRTFTVRKQSTSIFTALRKFATTAGIPAGRVRITPYRGPTWTNGASGFALADLLGVFRCDDAKGDGRRTLEFRLDAGRLAGTETVEEAGSRYARDLRNVTLDDTGVIEFDMSTRRDIQQGPGNTTALSFRWSSDGDRARLTRTGIELDGRTYAARPR